MVQCFAPGCNHQSESHTCNFFRFPKEERQARRWKVLIRRQDREPNSNSRVCSCHFREKNNKNDPEIFSWNAEKLFPQEPEVKRKRKFIKKVDAEEQEEIAADVPVAGPSGEACAAINEIILEQDLKAAKAEIESLKSQHNYHQFHFSVNGLKENVICMETGIPTKKVFWILVNYTKRFEKDIQYYYGWRVTGIKFEDQILITLMKLRQNYTNLHLAQLFSCSEKTISNITLTFIYVLHELFFQDVMQRFPSRHKNKIVSPASFLPFPNCRIVIDCTDVKIAIPKPMNLQRVTYSSYRSMNSFKVLIGVAPNAVVTYVSNLYPGSTSDKAIVENSGILSHFVAGDLILADKGFLISEIIPVGVHVNIPPFLEHGKFTRSEIIATKKIAKCRIHVERANARIKEYKILSFIPAWLRSHADRIVQLIAALVNLQFPLIKESCEGINMYK